MLEMTRGELAKQCGIHPETIRYYERAGLLEPAARTEAGYRMFDESAAARISFIKRAQAVGFSLGEIRALLALRDTPTATAESVRSLTAAKLAEVEAKINALLALRASLQDLLAACPGADTPLDDCPIIDHLSEQEDKAYA